MSQCKYCGKEIQWIETLSGKRMPCDMEKICMFRGDTTTLMTITGRLVRCSLTGNESTFVGYGYKPHWTDCSGAKQARADKREKEEQRLF